MGTKRPIIEVPESREYALKIRHEGIKAGWEQWYFLMSDCHWDAPESYLKLIHEHLKEAKDRNALVIDAGDFYEVISGAGDPRSSKGTIREERVKVNYLDRQLIRRRRRAIDDAVGDYLERGDGNFQFLFPSTALNPEPYILTGLLSEQAEYRPTGLTVQKLSVNAQYDVPRLQAARF